MRQHHSIVPCSPRGESGTISQFCKRVLTDPGQRLVFYAHECLSIGHRFFFFFLSLSNSPRGCSALALRGSPWHMLGRGVSGAVKRLGDCMCSSFITLLGSRPVAPAAVWGTLLKWLLQRPGMGVVRGSTHAGYRSVGIIQKGTMRTLDPMAWEGQKLEKKKNSLRGKG